MADINPPIGDSGGEQLARDAAAAERRERAALKKAGKTVVAVEGTAAEIKALRRRLSKTMLSVVDAIGRGETPSLGRNAGSTLNALERHGILETSGTGRDLTRLGRQIAGLEAAAERKAKPKPKVSERQATETRARTEAAFAKKRAERAEADKTKAAEDGRKKRARVRKTEGGDVQKALGDSAAAVEAAARRNAADVEAALARAKAHADEVKRGKLPPVDSEAHRAAVEAERRADEEKRKALARRRQEIVPRTRAHGAVDGPLFGQYPYAPLGREQAIPQTGPDAAELKRRADYVKNAQRVERQSVQADARRNLVEFKRAAAERKAAAKEAEASEKAAAKAAASRRAAVSAGGPFGIAGRPEVASQEAALAAQRKARKGVEAAVGKQHDALDKSFGRYDERQTKAVSANTAAVAANDAVKARLAQTDAYVAQAQTGAAAGFQRQAVAAGISSQALTRHGYLTSEAIEAAKRGELTYKQWGQQISGTAAKFAGWTAVSIPVFAALAGAQKIGAGAIASSSGVGKLSRVVDNVDGGRLQGQFRGLSGKFNVPIDEVSDSVARMGQVFKDQEGAVQGATAALYAFRTGGVDVEAGSKNLIAIANGFKLAGSEILPFFDQINEAQNEFGVTIPDSLAGLAKAAGAFGNAGGSKDFLLSLIGTGKLTTGRTGENIGTAIQRSVGFLSRPSNQEALKGFGIDPTAGIEQVYTQAFKVAEDLSGKELQRLATALSSPQYASYFVPILQNYQKFQDIQKGTSPGSSKDSAANELSTIMGQLDERIKSIGVSLGLLGSNLAQGGFLSGIEAMVFAFDQALNVVNGILGVFNLLPGPLKTAVSLALQLKGLQLVARRVPGLGDALSRGPLAGAAPYLQPSQTRTDAVRIRSGLNANLQGRRDELERIDKEALRAHSERGIAQQVYTRSTADVQRRVAAGTLSEVDAQQIRLAAMAELEAAERAAVRSTLRAAVAKKATLAAELELANASAAQARAGEAGLVRYANQRGLYAAETNQSPSTATILRGGPGGLAPEGVTPGGVIVPAKPNYSAAATAAAAAPVGRGRLSVGEMNRAEAVAEGARREQASLRGHVTRYGASMKRWGVSVRATAATLEASSAIARGASGSLRGAGSSLGRAAASIGAALGPLDALLIGAFALFEVISSGAELGRKLDTKVSAAAADPVRLRALSKDLGKYDASTGAQLKRLYEYPLDVVTTPLKLLPGGGLDYKNSDVRRYEAKQGADKRAKFLENERVRGRQKTIPQIQQTLQEALPGASIKEQIDAVNLALAEAAQGYAAKLPDDGKHKEAKAALAAYIVGLNGQLRDLQATGGLIAQAVNGLNTPEDFETFNADRGARAGLRGRTTRQDARAAGLARIRATRLLAAGEFTPAQALKAMQDAEAGVLEPAEKQLNDLLAVAKNPKQSRAAFRQFRGVATGVYGRGKIVSALQSAQRKLLSLQGDLASAPGATGAFGALPDAGAAVLGKEARRGQTIISIGQSIDAQNGVIRKLLELLGISTRNLAAIGGVSDQLHDARFAQNTELLISRETTPAGKQRVAEQRAKQDMGRINKRIKDGRGNVGDRAAREIALNNTMQQGLEQASADAQANFEARIGLATSRAAAGGASDYALAQRAVSDAQAIYNRISGEKGADSTEALNALRSVYDAKGALNDLVKQEAKALLESVFNLRASRTDDPVKLAGLEAQKAKRILAKGGFDTKAERNDAKAERNKAVRDKAATVADRRIEQLSLDEEIGRITTQQEIAGLQRILGIANLGTEKKRQIRSQILRLKHQMDQEGQLDLEVGNVRVPTLLELRRFTGGSRGAVSIQQTNYNTVQAKGTDASEVIELLGHTARTTTRAAARAAGIRG